MITYKYNFFIDLLWSWRTIRNYRWLKSKQLKIFLPNPLRMICLILHKPLPPDIFTEKNFICFWIHSGTWGSYTPPNKIFVCPWEIKNIKKIINHEITHLKYYKKTKDMPFEEREKFINKIR